MEKLDRKAHWDSIYALKNTKEVSWYQEIPLQTINIVETLNLSLEDRIIDVGAGDSRFVDYLLKMNYSNVDILDIALPAIEKAKARLGEQAKLVNWIVSDVLDFWPNQPYQLWYDRASFHFLNSNEEIQKYVDRVSNSIQIGGYFILGTFSKNGPKKCSGIEIVQYAKEDLIHLFSKDFDLVNSFVHHHPTPFDTVQEFIFCIFKRK